MKHIIEFNLPDDQEELESYQKHALYARFHRELYNEVFRSKIKYSENEESLYFAHVWSDVSKFMKELENA